uniref:RING-type domain-containing protein n=1 Tax=Enterobius vermicularis TaxID=51028 RepID=A0A0N4UWT3_ENTVE
LCKRKKYYILEIKFLFKQPGINKEHLFCYKCIRGEAKEVVDGSGKLDLLGIPCMSGDSCPNVLFWNDIRKALPSTLKKRLSAMIQDANLRASGMEIESCKICGFSGIPELPKEQDQIFRCPECGAQHCR